MFSDVEEYGGYDQDLQIESADNNYEVNQQSEVDQFFPKDLSDDDEPEEIRGKKRMKSKEAFFEPDALDWYLRVNLDSDYNKKAAVKLSDELFEKTLEKINSFKQSGDSADAVHHNLSTTSVSFEDVSDKFEVKIFKYPPRNSVNWCPITSLQGQRYYILTKPEQNVNSLKSGKYSNANLIDNFPEVLRLAEKLQEQTDLTNSDESSMEIDPHTVVDFQNLWVDKYRANYYTDLLSDDGVNRTILTWLKLWDECVFKIVKPKVAFKPIVTQKFPFASSWKQQNADDLSKDLDQFRRPQHKVALLCGPPGVGKTTLAHICARHCGYFVQEMNASDDRTLDAFRKQLENATQMTATLDSGYGFRPHCLIIDEIDGAPSPSIDYLVTLIKAGNNNDNAAKNSKKQVLSRPIICICNDLYVPALKELRKVALVLHVPSVEPRRLSDRLNCIGKKESVLFGSSVLEILCEKSENDVRSCINTLQFLSIGKLDKKILPVDVNHANVGLKDLHKSLFSVWQDLFSLPKIKRKRHHENNVNPTSIRSRVAHVITIVDQTGEMDRVIDGLHENFLNVAFKDTSMDNVGRGLAWLQMYDRLDTYIGQSQCYDFFVYKHFVPVVFHLSYASTSMPPRLQFPQARFNTTKNLSTLKTLLNEMPPTVRLGIHMTSLILDTLPYLLFIIQPLFRAVNIQMFSVEEREKLNKLVGVMRSCNVTYRQERGADGKYVFVLEPALDNIVQYPSTLALRKQLSYVLKQFIAREIEISKFSSVEPKLTVKPKEKSHQKATAVDAAKEKSFEERPRRNFFGILLPSTSCGDKDGPFVVDNSSESLQVWFRYNEGSSNAVRRNVKIVDMLQ